MVTFIIGLVMLFGGAALYGKLCEKVFGPDDRKTPAYTKNDGVDYVPMKGWKNSLINLLNIAGTGPILGPIQGILFGPIAFITIPIGNVIGGAMHDYFSGMICLRDGGTQMPDMVKRYTNKGIFTVYNIFVCLLLLLVGAVFIYTPGDIAATQVFNFSGAANATSTWVIYGVIFAYYLIATVFPIDKIIGRIYPIFGGILLFSAIGVFIGLFVKGYPLVEVWNNVWEYNGVFNYSEYFANGHFFPIFFVTVACGILSGFHSTQTAIISRTMKSERQGRNTFYNMMILEGFIAMVWAAGAMGVYNLGLQAADASLATKTVGIVCKDILGNVGGIIALLGVIVLPITSGDTALRALRLYRVLTRCTSSRTPTASASLCRQSSSHSSRPSSYGRSPVPTASASCGATSRGQTRLLHCSRSSASPFGCLKTARASGFGCLSSPARSTHLSPSPTS